MRYSRFAAECRFAYLVCLLVLICGATDLLAQGVKTVEKRPATGSIDAEKLRETRDRLRDLGERGVATPQKDSRETPLREGLLGGAPFGVPEGMLRDRIALARERAGWTIYRNEHNGTPTFVSGVVRPKVVFPPLSSTPRSAVSVARAFVERHEGFFQLESARAELDVLEEHRCGLGQRHVKFGQRYRGVRLWRQELVVHLDSDLNVVGLNARYSPTPARLSIRPLIDGARAIELAVAALADKGPLVDFNPRLRRLLGYAGPQATLTILVDKARGLPATLVWHVPVRTNIRDHWYVFVNASTGAIVERYNATAFDGPVAANGTDRSGTNRGLQVYEQDNEFYMIDGSRSTFLANQPNVLWDPKGAIWTLDVRGQDISKQGEVFQVTSADNTWNDPTAVSAHFNAGSVFEYYEGVHNRLGLDAKGTTILGIIHVGAEGGGDMDNAYWNGKFMAYGDGRRFFKPFAGGLDVAAHEFTHGVIDHTVNLEYKFQSGALNESFADVFAAMVDREDWKIGEDIVLLRAFPSGTMRDMEDPHNGGQGLNDRGWQPAHVDEFVELSLDQDNGGVHVNSGIPNRACALIGNSIGKEKTERIYYRVLDARYLNARSNFVDMRLAALRAAEDLFGGNSEEFIAVAAGFDSVGIVGDQGQPPPPDLPPVEGDEWIAVANYEQIFPGVVDTALYLSRPTPTQVGDIVRMTETQVFVEGSNPITISGDGSVIVFVTAANTLQRINSDGSEEVPVNDEPLWWSVALSPVGNILAMTTIEEDSKIFILDLTPGGGVQEVDLYNPTTQDEVRDSTVRFADALAWDNSGTFLIYDAFNSVPQADGGAVEFWDINVLDVETGTILSVFDQLPEGVSIGNPSLGQTRDNLLVLDVLDSNQQAVEVWAVDLFRGVGGPVLEGLRTVARPKFSPDDSWIILEQTANVTEIDRFPLSADGLSISGPGGRLFTGAVHAQWFVIGQRPLDLTPTLAAINPASGPSQGGTPFTLSGNNFVPGETQVFFDNSAASGDVDDVTTYRGTTPPGTVGAVSVRVVTPNGEAVLSQAFTYFPTPQLFTSIDPGSGPVAGGISLDITGEGFVAGETRFFLGGTEIVGGVINGTRFRGTLPEGSVGYAQVRIESSGNVVESSSQAFYYEGSPIVDSVSPNEGPVSGGTAVLFRGRGLKDTTAVVFGGTAAAAIQVIDDTLVRAVTTARAGEGIVDLTIQTSHGQVALPSSFEFTPVVIQGTFDLLSGKAKLGKNGWTVKIARATFDPGGATISANDRIQFSLDGFDYFGCDSTVIAKIKIDKRTGSPKKISLKDGRGNKATIDFVKRLVKVVFKGVTPSRFDPTDGVDFGVAIGPVSGTLRAPAVIAGNKQNKALMQAVAGELQPNADASPCP